MLAKAVANESDAYFISINGPEIMSKYYGESEKALRDLFEEAEKNTPAIIFLDELDSIAPKRGEVTGEVERRVVAQLLSLMDGLKERKNVIVIGSTNRPEALDMALRRPGRFDREIELGVPDMEGRMEIFQIHTRGMPLHEDVVLEDFAKRTYGFVGADISAVGREAAMNALRRILPEIDLDEPTIPKEILDRLIVQKDDFEAAMREVQPSAMREILVEVPNVNWEDIGGLESVKQLLVEAVEWPLRNAESFRRLGIEAPKGILLYGPPGTGKTMLAKAVANESEANFITVKGSCASLQVVWREREESGRDLPKGQAGGSVHHLPGRAGCAGAHARRSAGRAPCHRAHSKSALKRDGRPGGAAGSGGNWGHQPAGYHRSGAAAAGTL